MFVGTNAMNLGISRFSSMPWTSLMARIMRGTMGPKPKGKTTEAKAYWPPGSEKRTGEAAHFDACSEAGEQASVA